MSFLAIDVGNTRLKWALYAAPQPGAALLAHGAVFLENIDRLAEVEWANLPAPSTMLGCIVAGDSVRRRVQEQMEIWDVEPRWVVASSFEAGVYNHYEHPNRLGADRFVAMVGAHERMMVSGAPRPVVTVMVGTAVTVDAMDAKGNFLGGLILPGFGLMLKALEMGTAGLKVPTGEVVDFPVNTSDALMSGGVYAMAGSIERMHRKLAMRCAHEPALYMTGGAAVKLAPVIELPMETVDALIFDGLLRIQAGRTSS